MKKTLKQCLCSLLAMIMIISAFLGTTFAWFTDVVTSGGNIIASGNLKASMEWSDDLSTWTNAADGPIFNYDKWEPGYTELKYIKISNIGSLNFKWNLYIEEEGKVTELSDVIEVYYVNPADHLLTKDEILGASSVGTLTDILANHQGVKSDIALTPGESLTLAIAFHMNEEAGNEYQNMELCSGGFAVKLLATQEIGENDSFGNDYDVNAEWPYSEVNYRVPASVEGKVDATTNSLSDSVNIGDLGDTISAQIPEGTKLANGATELTLEVKSVEVSHQDISVEAGESAKSVDVHIAGLAEDNTVPVTITLKKLFSPNLNTTSVKMFHVENDTPVEMTLVSSLADLDTHNEFYYDLTTGDVVMCVASFSEYVTVEDDLNKWEGSAVTSWYNDTDTEFVLTTAEQLAGFGVLVDNGNDFKDKTIKLGADIDLGGTISFNPIGFGYDYAGYNSPGKTTGVFKGTFDGQNYTISNLYVNGWDIGISYSNSGGGLFASVCDATIKNLIMSKANVIMECVEQGVVAGLAQGTCSFENIKIYGCGVANYQRATGGVVGEVSPKYNSDGSVDVSNEQTTTFKDILIDADTVVGSLWGDFDAPVGGVVGARWDDNDATTIVMNNVTVAARLDVYNDVTSTYQWYAYRRAGMLIGNTERVAADGRTAAADFLKCNDVTVYYGNWVNYHYCEFNNHNSSWPFVRVEAGEHCNAFSNPRWGVPNDINGVKVTPDRHSKQDYTIHQDGDDCYVELTFNQLYGGGQGVYGQTTHDGVTIENLAYTITYVNDSEVLDIVYVTDNSTAYSTENETAQALVVEWVKGNIDGDVVFGGWMNAGSTKLTEIPTDNEDNIVLYPYFNSPYTASFVDQNGNILAWCFFNEEDTSKLNDTMSTAQAKLPYLGEEYVFDYWEVRGTKEDGTTIKEEYNIDNFTSYGTDVTVYPYFIFNGTVQLIPIDEDNDGDTDYYRVDGSNISKEAEDISIPAYVNGVPVEVINTGAFSDGRLRDVYVPNTIEVIGKNAFCKDDNGGFLDNGEFPQIQIIFDGTKAEWDALSKESGWDDNIGSKSVVVCVQEPGGGYYLQNGSNGIWGAGISIKWEWQADSYPDWYPRATE